MRPDLPRQTHLRSHRMHNTRLPVQAGCSPKHLHAVLNEDRARRIRGRVHRSYHRLDPQCSPPGSMIVRIGRRGLHKPERKPVNISSTRTPKIEVH